MNYSHMTEPGPIKYTPNDLTSLKEVKIFDKHGKLKRIIQAERVEDIHSYTIKKEYGQDICRECDKLFTLYKKKQYTCGECIKKRKTIGLSLRRS